MSENHKMSKEDKMVDGITLAAIFYRVLGIGLLGMIINIFS